MIDPNHLSEVEKRLRIMQAAVEGLIHVVEEYNPNDEIAEGAAWSVSELREAIQKLTK